MSRDCLPPVSHSEMQSLSLALSRVEIHPILIAWQRDLHRIEKFRISGNAHDPKMLFTHRHPESFDAHWQRSGTDRRSAGSTLTPCESQFFG